MILKHVIFWFLGTCTSVIFLTMSHFFICCIFAFVAILHLLHFCRVGHLQVWRLGRLGSLQQGKSAEDQKGFTTLMMKIIIIDDNDDDDNENDDEDINDKDDNDRDSTDDNDANF